MTVEDIALLERVTDYVVALELTSGEQFFAEIIMVVNQQPTPDVFLLRVLREPDGAFLPTTTAGESILLDEISRIALIPGVPYPEAPDPEPDPEPGPEPTSEPAS